MGLQGPRYNKVRSTVDEFSRSISSWYPRFTDASCHSLARSSPVPMSDPMPRARSDLYVSTTREAGTPTLPRYAQRKKNIIKPHAPHARKHSCQLVWIRDSQLILVNIHSPISRERVCSAGQGAPPTGSLPCRAWARERLAWGLSVY